MAARTTFVWGAYERSVINGDSLVAGGIGGVSVPWRAPLLDPITLTYAPYAGCRRGNIGLPLAYDINGFSGTTMAVWASNAASLVLGHGYTICFVAWGVNDASGSVAPATTAANLATGINAVWASEPGIKMVVVGPMNNGQLWPQGANPTDANIAATSAAMQAECDVLSASGVITWIDPRTYWFATIPTYNPTNVNGPTAFCLTVDNLHLNSQGAGLVANGAIWSQRVAA